MIEAINKTNYHISSSFIKKTLNYSIKYLKIKNPVLSVVFVTPITIKKLNLIYRHKNKTTDVLSFSYHYDKNNLDGEIVICYSIAKQQARQFKHTVNQEIIKLLVHSLLHLVGYDHQNINSAKKMEKIENNIIKNI